MPAHVTTDLERRKAEHEALRQLANKYGGALESAPGDYSARVSCPVGSLLPAALRQLGYEVSFSELCSQINPMGKVDHLVQHAEGRLEFVASGGTTTRSHATIGVSEIYTVTGKPTEPEGRYIPGSPRKPHDRRA